MQWTEIATALSAIGALVLAVVTFIWSVHENRKTSVAVQASAQAAAASARAAELSTDHFRRMADALESSLSADDAQRIAITNALPTPSAVWSVEHVKGGTYELANSGTGSAYEVKVDALHAVRFEGPGLVPEWKPGERQVVRAFGSSQTGIPELHVTWRATPVDPETDEWTRLLPAG